MYGSTSSSSSKRAAAPSSYASFFAAAASSSSATSSNNKLTKRRRSTTGEDGSSFGTCPLCNSSFPLHRLHIHASLCEGEGNADRGSTTRSHRVGQTSNACSQDGPSVPVAKEAGSSRPSGPHPPTEASSSPGWVGTDMPAAESAQAPGAIGQPPSAPASTKVATPIAAAESEQQDLLPPGLCLYENFVTEEEEEQILKELDGEGENPEVRLPWKASTFNGSMRGKRWGVHCQLRNRCVTPAEHQLPDFAQTMLLPRLRDLSSMISGGKLVVPNEANAIDYRKPLGHWLKSHVDDRYLSKEPIANLSLAGDCIMTYTLVSSSSSASTMNQQTYRVLLRRRTLQVLTGQARYAYSHGINNADLLSPRRVSITLRESPLTNSAGSISKSMATAALSDRNPTKADPAAAWWKRPRALPNSAAASIVPKPLLLPPSSSSFSLVPTPIPGLLVFENFVSPEDEAMILSELEGGDTTSGAGTAGPVPASLQALVPAWKSERHSGIHREKRYGMDSELWSRTVKEPKHPMPSFVQLLLLPKLRRALADSTAGWNPNEGNAIEYCRGHSWLKAHVDDRRKHKELIVNLSLAGNCYMTFARAAAPATSSSSPAAAAATAQAPVSVSVTSLVSPQAGNSAPNRNDFEVDENALPSVLQHPKGAKVLLRRRTLLVLTGKARYEYTHGIDQHDVLSDRRVSFTLRETA